MSIFTSINYLYTELMPVHYEYTGDLIPNTFLTFELQIQFQLRSGQWTDFSTLIAIIDTGATFTHISETVVPPEIVAENRENTSSLRTPFGEVQGFRIQNSQIQFPGVADNG